MAIVVRVGPLPLGRRLAARTVELERILGTIVQVIKVGSVAALVTVIALTQPAGVALEAERPGSSRSPLPPAGTLPVLRPLWRRQRNARGEIEEAFDGCGLLRGPDIARLADDELAVTRVLR